MPVTQPIPELVVGAVIAGKYRVESLLGRGGMGAVYLATNEDLGRHVAIKVLLREFAQDEALLKRFRQEARTAAAIGHPGIVDVFDLGTTEDGAPFIVMEALEGETLGGRITRERRLAVDLTVQLVTQALDALAAAHDKGVLHRDLKPDNLFIVARPAPTAKILDFGISKLGGTDDVALTNTGMVLGTPLYMAPEQARGAKNAGPASDVYSMGAILYHALVGRPPFVGMTYNEVLEKLFTQPAPLVSDFRSDVPPELVALIARMLAKDPLQRPASALEASSELAAISQLLQTWVPPPDSVAATMAPTQEPERPVADRSTMKSLGSAPAAVAPTYIPPVPRPSAQVLAVAETRQAPSVAVPLSTVAVRPSRVPWLVGGGALLAGGIVLAVVVLGRTDEHAVVAAHVSLDAGAPQSRDAVAATDAAVAAITLRLLAPVAVHWSGTGVACDERKRCAVSGAAGTHAVATATAAGFEVADVELVFDFDREIRVKLEPLARVLRDAGVARVPDRPIDAAPSGLDIEHTNPLKP